MWNTSPKMLTVGGVSARCDMEQFPVDPAWACRRCGESCRLPEAVVMTLEEQVVVQAAADKVLTMGQLSKMVWEPSETAGFVNLKARPCPLLTEDGGNPVCSIRESRPYSCRRFMCLRPDPKTEPMVFMPHMQTLTYGTVGVVNL